jgi:hypothetical protein
VDGVVTKWVETEAGSFGRIFAEGVSYRVSGRDVELDSIGRCLLQKDEPVTFVPERHKTADGNRLYAVRVKRPWAENIDPLEHREICKVLGNEKNWLIRQLGGRLTIDRDEMEFHFLQDGQIVECGVCPPSRGTTWRAVDIKILAQSEDEFDWDSADMKAGMS